MRNSTEWTAQAKYDEGLRHFDNGDNAHAKFYFIGAATRLGVDRDYARTLSATDLKTLIETNQQREGSMRNPWADRWEAASYSASRLDARMMRHEAQEARAYPSRTDAAGTAYFFRPGVGGWWSADGQLWKDGAR